MVWTKKCRHMVDQYVMMEEKFYDLGVTKLRVWYTDSGFKYHQTFKHLINGIFLYYLRKFEAIAAQSTSNIRWEIEMRRFISPSHPLKRTSWLWLKTLTLKSIYLDQECKRHINENDRKFLESVYTSVLGIGTDLEPIWGLSYYRLEIYQRRQWNPILCQLSLLSNIIRF